MARFRIGYSEEYVGHIYFEADSETKAQEMIDKINDGHAYWDDLPGFYQKTTNGQSEFIDDLEKL